MDEQKNFEEFREEYSLNKTSKSRKMELIKLMRENLKKDVTIITKPSCAWMEMSIRLNLRM